MGVVFRASHGIGKRKRSISGVNYDLCFQPTAIQELAAFANVYAVYLTGESPGTCAYGGSVRRGDAQRARQRAY